MATSTQSSRRQAGTRTKTTKKTKSKASTTKRSTKAQKEPVEEPTLRVIDGKDHLEPQPTPSEEAMQTLREMLRGLGGEIGHLVDLLPEDYPLPGLDPELISESINQAETFLEKPSFVVGFAGGFNAGKSMLINALLGQHILKDGAVPTTSTVTRIVACPPEEEKMIIHFFTPQMFETLFERYMEDFVYLYHHTVGSEPEHGRDHLTELLDDIKTLRERLEAEDWNDRIRSLDSFYDLILAFINHQNLLSSEPIQEKLTRKNLIHYTTKSENSVAPLVREVQIELCHPMLAEGSELIDLPGLGSPDPRDEEITVEALRGNEDTGKRECDAVVHVMDSLSPFRAGEDRLFQIYRRVWGESFSKRVFLVVSRWGKLERQSPEEMLAVGATIRKVADRYAVDDEKIFITDGRIGAEYEPLEEDEEEEREERERRALEVIQEELEDFPMPGGQSLFDATLQTMIDGNVPALRESLRYYLAFYKEFLHLSDAQRMLESQVSKIHQAASMHLPALDQLEDDEERFLEECKSDLERNLKEMRNRAREGLEDFIHEVMEEELLPRDLSALQEGLYQAASRRIDQQSPRTLQQKLFAAQLFTEGPLTNPVPWENFRFLLQQEVKNLNEELEHFFHGIIEQTIEKYQLFILEEIGFHKMMERSFGTTSSGREYTKVLNEKLGQLGHDLRLITRNINRLFFYEYSDVYHSRDHLDTLVDIRSELEAQLQDDQNLHNGDARRAARWLLRQKMDYHFRKLTTYLPLCFLQQLQETHTQIIEILEEMVYPLRQAYLQRLERREIGQEVDRIRHRYRQIRACLEQLHKVRDRMQESRQLLQEHRPNH